MRLTPDNESIEDHRKEILELESNLYEVLTVVEHYAASYDLRNGGDASKIVANRFREYAHNTVPKLMHKYHFSNRYKHYPTEAA